MKKQILLLGALAAFGFVSGQEKASTSAIAENLPEKKEIKSSEKKSLKEKNRKNTQKTIKAEKKVLPKRKFKKYYIDSSGQKRYVD